jgi:hypothetical protein
MKPARARLVFVLLAIPLASLPILAWGCGGDSLSAIVGDADSGSADSTVGSGGETDGASGSSDATAESSTGNDAGDREAGLRDARNVVDGRASDPGQILCGEAGACSTTTSFCCVRRNDVDGGGTDGGPADECVQSNNPGACAGGRKFECDEKADCPGQQICCLDITLTSACQAQCGLLARQLCRTDAECKGGEPCVAQVCSGAFVQTCGGLPPAVCP